MSNQPFLNIWRDYSRGLLSSNSRVDPVILGPLWFVGIAGLIWLTGGLSDGAGLAAVFGIGAFALAVPALARRGRWPSQELFVWYGSPSSGGRNRSESEQWGRFLWQGHIEDARAAAGSLEGLSSRDAQAWLDTLTSGSFDVAAYRRGVEAVSDPGERIQWAVRLAVAESFAAYVAGEDFRAVLTRARLETGPLHLARRDRLFLWGSRFGPAMILSVLALACLAVIR